MTAEYITSLDCHDIVVIEPIPVEVLDNEGNRYAECDYVVSALRTLGTSWNSVEDAVVDLRVCIAKEFRVLSEYSARQIRDDDKTLYADMRKHLRFKTEILEERLEAVEARLRELSEVKLDRLFHHGGPSPSQRKRWGEGRASEPEDSDKLHKLAELVRRS